MINMMICECAGFFLQNSRQNLDLVTSFAGFESGHSRKMQHALTGSWDGLLGRSTAFFPYRIFRH